MHVTVETVPAAPPRRTGVRRRLAAMALCLAATAVAGGAAGTFLRIDLPGLDGLDDRVPSQMTVIHTADGSELARFATEKRLLLEVDEIPESFRLALIASEDSRFLSHTGMDPVGVFRAALAALRAGEVSQGASTLTMQLAGNLFLDRSQRTFKRKLQEMFLAFEIERRYSKPEILRMYVNQVHFGHGLYGLAAASDYYFGKPATELDVAEAATLVGVLPRPASYTPFRNPGRATERRNLVLGRMVQEGYLAPDAARAHAARPIRLAHRREHGASAPWFREEVRRRLLERHGARALYRGGLVVETTLDRRLQAAADRALARGLRELDKRLGWRAQDVRRVPAEIEPERWQAPVWSSRPGPGDVTDGVVLETTPERALVRVGDRRGTLRSASIEWTGETRPDRLLRRGDVIRVRIGVRAAADGVAELPLELEQEPVVEGALVALDTRSGAIRALVGGFDFGRSQFDRAVQAERQPGSLFKPFVYAAALSQGWTLADTLLDEPTVFLDPRRPVPYQPENFERRYHATLTLRSALERSENIPTVKLLDRVGYDAVIGTAQALGVESALRPYPSLALGAFEVTLLEVTSAYAAFANQGLRVEPYMIERVTGPRGRLLEQAHPRVREAVDPQTAFLMNRALAGVIERGTGKNARWLGSNLAGKTGTTDENTDAWFVGYSPGLAVGVWVGHDAPHTLGRRETGARAALPIWIDFMRDALDGRDEDFERPPGIVAAMIDPATGLLAHGFAGCAERRLEFFREGTEPTRSCSRALHRKLRLPPPLQRYELDPAGALSIPPSDLARILDREPHLFFDPERRLLEYWGPERVVRVEVRPGAEAPSLRPLPPELDPSSWVGTDGRPATVVWMDGRPRPPRH
jgi:penicillin-binding protein 1A